MFKIKQYKAQYIKHPLKGNPKIPVEGVLEIVAVS
jgi:hypothetical protein